MEPDLYVSSRKYRHESSFIYRPFPFTSPLARCQFLLSGNQGLLCQVGFTRPQWKDKFPSWKVTFSNGHPGILKASLLLGYVIGQQGGQPASSPGAPRPACPLRCPQAGPAQSWRRTQEGRLQASLSCPERRQGLLLAPITALSPPAVWCTLGRD